MKENIILIKPSLYHPEETTFTVYWDKISYLQMDNIIDDLATIINLILQNKKIK